MADLPIGNEGALTGSTAKVVLAAPAAGKQRVVPAGGLVVFQCDSVVHDVMFQKHVGGSTYIIWKEPSVAPGIHVLLPKKVVLDAVDESLEVVLDANHTTTAPTFDVAALETS